MSVDWSQLSHEEIYARVQAGPGAGAAQASEDSWDAVLGAIEKAETHLYSAMNSSTDGWQGRAGDAARTSVRRLADWTIESALGTRQSLRAVQSQAYHAADVRAKIEPPRTAEWQAMIGELILRPDRLTRVDDAQRLHRDMTLAEERAVDIMTAYTESSENRSGELGGVASPPVVTVASGSAAPGLAGSGLAASAGAFGAAAGGSAGALGAGVGGGWGGAGSATAGAAPAGPGIGAGPMGAPGMTGPGGGAAGGPVGPAPVGGIGGAPLTGPSGSGPGSAAGRAGVRPGVGASGASDQDLRRAPTATGQGVPGASTSAGGPAPGTRSRGGPVPGTRPPGGSPVPGTSPRGTSTPGLATPSPRPPAGGARSVPASPSGGGAQGWRDVVAANRPGATPWSDRAVAGRLQHPTLTPSEPGSPGRGTTAGERAAALTELQRGAARPASASGHPGMYPPMAGTGANNQDQTRARPAWLLDTDNIWDTSHIPAWPRVIGGNDGFGTPDYRPG